MTLCEDYQVILCATIFSELTRIKNVQVNIKLDRFRCCFSFAPLLFFFSYRSSFSARSSNSGYGRVKTKTTNWHPSDRITSSDVCSKYLPPKSLEGRYPDEQESRVQLRSHTCLRRGYTFLIIPLIYPVNLCEPFWFSSFCYWNLCIKAIVFVYHCHFARFLLIVLDIRLRMLPKYRICNSDHQWPSLHSMHQIASMIMLDVHKRKWLTRSNVSIKAKGSSSEYRSGAS